MKRSVLLVLSLLISGNGIGQTGKVHSFYSGMSLLRDCGFYIAAMNKQANQAGIDAATICAGYVMGASDTHSLLAANGASPVWCAPANIELRQLVQVAHAYLQKTPQVLHHPAADILFMAFNQAYPCD